METLIHKNIICVYKYMGKNENENKVYLSQFFEVIPPEQLAKYDYRNTKDVTKKIIEVTKNYSENDKLYTLEYGHIEDQLVEKIEIYLNKKGAC